MPRAPLQAVGISRNNVVKKRLLFSF
uniref:Uncharacterized protein n=1 Tax=Anguilla anguilla TaxID=7936 RepID=A0A0E9RQN6_ANGAN